VDTSLGSVGVGIALLSIAVSLAATSATLGAARPVTNGA
jgi:hypothetical protein